MAMDAETPPRAAEAVEVVLARMDGKLDRIWDRFSDLDPRVGKLEDRMKIQEDLTLTLSKDAEAEKAKAEALAFALKEQDETRRNQSEQSWTPVQRFFAVVGGIGVVAALIIQFYSTVKG
jgi:hypothetical protein